jgi:hypothetical protein
LTVLRLIISSYPVAPELAGRPAFPNDDAIDVACLVPALVNLPFGPRVNVVVPRRDSQGTVIIILVHNRPSGDPTPSRADCGSRKAPGDLCTRLHHRRKRGTCEFQGAEVDLAVSTFGAKAEEAASIAPSDGGAPKHRLCWLASSGAGAQSLRGGRGVRAPRESFRAATGKPHA